MKRKHLFLTVVGAILLAAGFLLFLPTSTKRSGPYSPLNKHADSIAVSQLRWLESANATSDFQTAISERDFRFFGKYGYGPYIPGIDRPDDSLVAAAGVRYIEGTSDALLSDEHARLNQLARTYATLYNQLLLRYLRQGKAR